MESPVGKVEKTFPFSDLRWTADHFCCCFCCSRRNSSSARRNVMRFRISSSCCWKVWLNNLLFTTSLPNLYVLCESSQFSSAFQPSFGLPPIFMLAINFAQQLAAMLMKYEIDVWQFNGRTLAEKSYMKLTLKPASPRENLSLTFQQTDTENC